MTYDLLFNATCVGEQDRTYIQSCGRLLFHSSWYKATNDTYFFTTCKFLNRVPAYFLSYVKRLYKLEQRNVALEKNDRITLEPFPFRDTSKPKSLGDTVDVD